MIDPRGMIITVGSEPPVPVLVPVLTLILHDFTAREIFFCASNAEIAEDAPGLIVNADTLLLLYRVFQGREHPPVDAEKSRYKSSHGPIVDGANIATVGVTGDDGGSTVTLADDIVLYLLH